MSSKRDFCLSEDADGVFREVCKAYGLDASLLSWQFERHVILNGATPFRMRTNDFAKQVSLKDGVDKVEVEVQYSNGNANDIEWIRFHEMPSNRYYIITQTSMKHIDQESTCPLWLELPPDSRKEDMATVQNFHKVEICCGLWKDFLPTSPVTALERAFLVFASEDVDWVKKQLVHKDGVTRRLTSIVAFKNIEIDALKNEIENLRGKLDEKLATKQEVENEKAALRAVIKGLEARLAEKTDLLDALDLELQTPQTPPPNSALKKRKMQTPKSKMRHVPSAHAHTDPVVTQASRHPLPETPTKKGTSSLEDKK